MLARADVICQLQNSTTQGQKLPLNLDDENRGLYTAEGSPTARENVGVMDLLACGVNVMRSGKGR